MTTSKTTGAVTAVGGDDSDGSVAGSVPAVPAATLCRLTVHAPQRAFELVVPSNVPLADLMPTLLGYAGEDLAASGLAHDGWVLQRLGETPLHDEGTLGLLGLFDGDTLYLRPRQDALPSVHFDDLVDAVATTMADRADTWRPELSKRLLLALAAAVLGFGLLVLALPGTPVLRAGCAAGAALLLLGGAVACSRAVGDGVTATVLGVAATPYLALAGYLVPDGGSGLQLSGARVLAAFAAGAGGAVLALAAVAGVPPLFLSAAIGSALGVVGAGGVVAGLSPPAAAGLAAVLAVLVGGLVPGLAFRLSGLRLPPLPTDAEELQEEIEPHPSGQIVARAELADQYMTGLYTAAGLTCAIAITVLATSSGWPAYTLAAALSAMLLLHGRAMGGMWHRLATVLAGAFGAIVLALRLAAGMPVTERVAVLVTALSLVATLLLAAWTVPGRRLVPYWGRAADLLHLLIAASLLPLLAMELGLYHFLRTLTG